MFPGTMPEYIHTSIIIVDLTPRFKARRTVFTKFVNVVVNRFTFLVKICQDADFLHPGKAFCISFSVDAFRAYAMMPCAASSLSASEGSGLRCILSLLQDRKDDTECCQHARCDDVEAHGEQVLIINTE